MSYAPLDESRGRSINGSASVIPVVIHHEDEEDDKAVQRSPTTFGVGGSTASSSNRRALSEPLTNGDQAHISSDPFYVFREDLYRQLERVDESLAEYLRVVHQTVRTVGSSAKCGMQC